MQALSLPILLLELILLRAMNGQVRSYILLFFLARVGSYAVCFTEKYAELRWFQGRIHLTGKACITLGMYQIPTNKQYLLLGKLWLHSMRIT